MVPFRNFHSGLLAPRFVDFVTVAHLVFALDRTLLAWCSWETNDIGPHVNLAGAQ